MYYAYKVCHYPVVYVSVMDGSFQTGTVYVHAHALN